MADFVPQYTPRLKVSYTSLGASHKLQFRMPRGTAVAALAPFFDKIDVFLSALSPFRYTDWAITAVEFAATDSVLFFPVLHTINPSAGTQVLPSPIVGLQKALEMGFSGRSVTGGRAVMYVYGVALGLTTTVTGDSKVTSGENAAVASAVDVLNGGDPFVANDNGNVVWKPYSIFKTNDYWRRRALVGG